MNSTLLTKVVAFVEFCCLIDNCGSWTVFFLLNLILDRGRVVAVYVITKETGNEDVMTMT
jgi:hypothetical protein